MHCKRHVNERFSASDIVQRVTTLSVTGHLGSELNQQPLELLPLVTVIQAVAIIEKSESPSIDPETFYPTHLARLGDPGWKGDNIVTAADAEADSRSTQDA